MDRAERSADYITIVLAGSAPGTYGDYQYTQNFVGKAITLHAPATAGSYEIRYQSDRGSRTSCLRLAPHHRPLTEAGLATAEA